MILLPRSYSSQPQGPVEIDRSNPITRGLATVFLPTQRYPSIDLITKVFDTAGTRGALLPGTNATRYSTTVAANWSLNFAPVGIPASYPALSVFALFEQYDTTTTGAIFGGGNNSTQYARFVKNNDGSVTFGPNSNTGGSQINGPVLNTNQVYALAAVNEGNYRELFVDAVSAASSSTSITFLNGAYGYAGSSFLAGQQRRIGLYCGYVWTRRLTPSEIKSLTDNPYQIFKRQNLLIPVQVGAVDYSLTANAGAYSLTGQAADLLRATVLSANSGAYVISGQAATLDYNQQRVLSANAGTYAVSGQAATLVKTNLLSANAGDYSVSGQDALLAIGKFLGANAGSYSIGGQDANFLYNRAVSANAGSYVIDGQDASLIAIRALSANAGNYAITGQAADLFWSRAFTAESGSYEITGQPATLSAATLYPAPGDVRLGVVYGPGGIYTGTLVVGGNPIYIFDD